MKKLVVLLTLIYSVAVVAQHKKELFVVTNHTQLGNTGETTGYFLSEVTHPLEVLTKELQKSPLRFDASKYTTQQVTQGDQTLTVRAYEGIVYVANPVEEQYQQLNLYIPEAYFNGGTINGFNAQTAPIFFPNGIGGYMPAKPLSLTGGKFKDTSNSLIMALSKGFVVASPGARGRTSATGKAPAVIVDLKAAVRYLKYNDKEIPGDANKIISNGTSAGGASSALLGASGDQADYEPYLKELGAAPATDAIFAVSAYCPITNLENADKAYEWQFGNLSQYKTMEISMLDYNVQHTYKTGTFTPEQTKVSADLKKDFPAYLNSLQLKDSKGKRLTLNAKGEGSFKELLKQTIIAAAEKAQKEGTDLSKYSFLTLKNGKVTAIDWEGYITYMERHKSPPAFDGLDLSTGENQLFGDSTTDKKHFTSYALKHSTVESQMADAKQISLMNPMSFIGKKNAHLAKHWRIRHGAKDSDTSAAISLILATALKNHHYAVDYALPWDKPHSGDYDLEELFDWAEKISK